MLVYPLALGDAGSVAKFIESTCGVSESSKSGYGWHSWIIPAAYVTFGYELKQFTFAGEYVFDV